MSLKQMWRH